MLLVAGILEIFDTSDPAWAYSGRSADPHLATMWYPGLSGPGYLDRVIWNKCCQYCYLLGLLALESESKSIAEYRRELSGAFGRAN